MHEHLDVMRVPRGTEKVSNNPKRPEMAGHSWTLRDCTAASGRKKKKLLRRPVNANCKLYMSPVIKRTIYRLPFQRLFLYRAENRITVAEA